MHFDDLKMDEDTILYTDIQSRWAKAVTFAKLTRIFLILFIVSILFTYNGPIYITYLTLLFLGLALIFSSLNNRTRPIETEILFYNLHECDLIFKTPQLEKISALKDRLWYEYDILDGAISEIRRVLGETIYTDEIHTTKMFINLTKTIRTVLIPNLEKSRPVHIPKLQDLARACYDKNTTDIIRITNELLLHFSSNPADPPEGLIMRTKNYIYHTYDSLPIPATLKIFARNSTILLVVAFIADITFKINLLQSYDRIFGILLLAATLTVTEKKP